MDFADVEVDVDRQRDAGDVAAGVTGQENQRGAEFVCAAEPSGQGARQHLGLEVPLQLMIELPGFMWAAQACAIQ